MEAIVKVMAPTSIYSWRGVRAGRSVTEWAQNMLRDAQAAEITGTTTVLRLVWTRIEPALQRDIREPTAATTISQFMADLDLRYGQWYEMSKRARPQQRPTQLQPIRYQGQQRYPQYNPQYGNTRYTYGRSNPAQGYQLPFRHRDTATDTPQPTWSLNRDPQRQQQIQRKAYPFSPNASQAPAQRQRLLSDKPWNQAGYSSTGYAARQPRTRPTAAYQADPQEVAPTTASPTAPAEANLANVPPIPSGANLANVAFYDGQYIHDPQADAYYAEEYTSYAEYPPEEDPQACWQAPPFLDDEESRMSNLVTR
ncbi:hypothetical protein N7463_010952 [Penicillium fimorum]|uniref:Uncharacterized protein n=1 Tax=Penicillium fimorum TaxID=1882269 RepID=A0A9W9XLP1_9EURO|nr:hypothetical protein N7463_010952 [Penicillium fimorum]